MISVLRGALAGPLWLPSKAAAPPSTLMEGLVSYWRMDEVSGGRADGVGANHLTDNNTVGYAAGKHNNAASFVAADSEFLSVADNPTLHFFGAGFTLSLWFWPDSYAAERGLVAKYSAPPTEFRLITIGGDGRLYFETGGVGAGYNILPALSLSAWHHVICGYDPATGLIFMSEDGGSTQWVTPAAVPAQSVNPVTIGAESLAPYGPYSGLIDGPAIWPRVLNADERAELWNGGAGKFLNGAGNDFE